MSSSPTSSSSTDAVSATYAGMLDVTCRVEVIVGTGSITVRDCLKLAARQHHPADAAGRLRSAGHRAGRAGGDRRNRHRRRHDVGADFRRAAAAGRRGATMNGALVTVRAIGSLVAVLGLLGLFVWALRRGSLKLTVARAQGNDCHRNRHVARRAPLDCHRRRRRAAAADRPDADDHFAPDRLTPKASPAGALVPTEVRSR